MDRSATADLSVLAVAAAVVAAGYGLDFAGVRIVPVVLLIFGGACVVAARVLLQPRFDPGVALVATATFGYAMWIASPAFLPVTNGPDVVHHLQLIHVIQRSGRLPHDAALYPYLLEMMNYTPGSHILAAAAGSLLEVDPLRIVYPLAAAVAGVKAASLYALGRRLIGAGPGAGVAALSAPLLAFVPAAYFFGSFVQFFFFAQVVSDAFAIGMLLALVRWTELHEDRDLVALAACGVGVVLTWPVWIAPAAATAAVTVAAAPMPRRRRAAVIAWTLGPALAVAAGHQLTHRGAAAIVASAGAVTQPSLAAFGAGFLVLASAGAAWSVRERAARPVLAFLAATLLLAGVLAAAAAGRGGAGRFYMAFKMIYLAVLPAAALASLALSRVAAIVSARLPRPRLVAACLPVLIAALVARGRLPSRSHGSLSLPARAVALWAGRHVPPACVDYFSSYWLTGYWLHLDVLGNPRLSDRMRHETFEFRDTAGKWIEGRGLPYAIVEDLSLIPREVRADMEQLYQAGGFVLVRNRRPAACPSP